MEVQLKAINKCLADNAKSGLWYGQVDMDSGKRLTTHFGALDAIFPAVLARYGEEDRARKLEESAYSMWTTGASSRRRSSTSP